ncbi:MAG: hypothetical protein ACQER9_00785 [Nanobdellota archaeon]
MKGKEFLNKKYDVCMVSSRHPLKDHRIFHKETMSLINKLNLNVLILAINNDKEEIIKGKNYVIYGIKGNQQQILGSIIKLFKILRKVKSRVYHIHDFEDLILTPYLKLIKRGKVIYDMHEDFIKMINETDYMSNFKRFILSKVAHIYEKFFVFFTDTILVVVEHHKKKFNRYKKNIHCISNFPRIRKKIVKNKKYDFVYCGTTNKSRGIYDILELSKKTPYSILLILSGLIEERRKLKSIIKKNKLNIDLIENLPYSKVLNEISKAKVGLVLFHNTPKRRDGISTKLMEYSMAKLPIIGTSFNPFMKKYIDENNLGFALDKINSEEIQKAFKKINYNYNLYSSNSFKALKNYNWENEEKKLIKLYEDLLK